MNAKAHEVGRRFAAFAQRQPRLGQVAFAAVRLVVAVVAVVFVGHAILSVINPAGAIGAGLSLLIAPAFILLIVFGLLAVSGKITGSEGDSAAAKGIASVAEKMMAGSGQAAVAFSRRAGPPAGRLAGAAVGFGILAVCLGHYPSERPTNAFLGWAHDLVGAFSRPSAPKSSGAAPEAVHLKAILKAIKATQPDLAPRWVFRKFTRSFEADTYDFRTKESGPADFKLLRIAWAGLTDDVRFTTHEPVARCKAVVDPPSFLVVFPRHDQPFPGLPDTDLRGFVSAHSAHYAAHPWSACLGLDHQGSPVWWDLADAKSPPNGIYAGIPGSGKSVSGPLSIVLQIALATPPDRFAVSILDSRKKEMAHFLSDLPHLDNLTIAKDSSAMADWFERLVAEVRDRQDRYAGRTWSPSSKDPLLLAVVEEWQAMMAGSRKEDRERIVAAADEIGAIARSVGVRLAICSQKATSDILETRILANLALRVMGKSRPEDYLATLGDRSVVIPAATPGRLAVAGLVGEGVVMIQGLYADERATKDIIAGLRAAYPNARPRQEAPEQPRPAQPDFTSRGPTRPEPQAARPSSGTAPIITQAALSAGDLHAFARLIWEAKESDHEWPSVTREFVRDLALNRGFTVPGNDALGEILDRLQDCGVLQSKGRSRRLFDRPWPLLSALLDAA